MRPPEALLPRNPTWGSPHFSGLTTTPALLTNDFRLQPVSNGNPQEKADSAFEFFQGEFIRGFFFFFRTNFWVSFAGELLCFFLGLFDGQKNREKHPHKNPLQNPNESSIWEVCGQDPLWPFLGGGGEESSFFSADRLRVENEPEFSALTNLLQTRIETYRAQNLILISVQKSKKCKH